MSVRLIFVGFIVGVAGGCTWTNLLHGDDYFWRHYAADVIICSIDKDVEDERNGKKPSGYLANPPSPELWQLNWNGRMKTLGVQSKKLPDAYRGPSQYQLAMYSLKSRREFGLPDVVPDGETAAFVGQAYHALDNDGRTACQWLNWRSPKCSVSPALYTPTYTFSRDCKGDT